MLVFYAPWCPKCHMMLPIVDELEKEFEYAYEITRIHIDEEKGLAEAYNVEIVPTFVFEKEHVELGRMTGIIGEQILRKRMYKLADEIK